MSEIRISAVDYAACRADLLSFRNANRETPRDETYLGWRYERRPNTLKPIIVFSANGTGRKIGCLSVTPHDYAIGSHTCSIGILGDISVDKDWRGKGIAEGMINYLNGLHAFQNLAAGVVLPNEAAARSLSKCGWQTVTKLRRYVKILNVEATLEGWFGETWLTTRLAALPNYFLQACSAENSLEPSPDYTWKSTDVLDRRLDRLWDECGKSGNVIGIRDHDHLTWRYLSHPLEKYRAFLLLKRSQLCGYVMFHVSEGRCHIDDWLCRDGNSCYVHLLSYFTKYIRKDPAVSSISILINEQHAVRSALRKLGFIKRPDYLRCMVKPHPALSGSDATLNPAAWFLTAGDKDV